MAEARRASRSWVARICSVVSAALEEFGDDGALEGGCRWQGDDALPPAPILRTDSYCDLASLHTFIIASVGCG